MKTRYNEVFGPQLWCSGGLTPTANPPVFEDLAHFQCDWILAYYLIQVLVMSEINTLVYFDIEATGLKSSGKPRICEISLVAVNTQDVLNLGVTNKKDNQFCEVTFSPRIVNKLTLCVYPMAIIVPLVSDLTGLDNYNLSGQSTFTKNTSDLINNFLACLPAPVCLIAHNGNAYDFPLLKAELEKLGTNLDAEILCADSYRAIKEIFSKKEENKNEILKETEDKYNAQSDVDAARELMQSGMFETDLLEGQTVTLNENESTPRNQKKCRSLIKPRKRSEIFHVEHPKIRKRLHFPNLEPPSSFSLVNLHMHILGVPPIQAHGAEADCLALLRITSTLGSDWINWVKENCYLFSSCQKMWSK